MFSGAPARRWVISLVAIAFPVAGQRALAPLLAPTGTLRAAFLSENPVLAKADGQTFLGPVPDLVKELARRIGVPYELVPIPGARDIIAHLQAHSVDLGFMAFNAERAADVDFSAPWLLMPNTYLVRVDSPLKSVADADRPGINIAAVKGDTQEVYLRNHLKNNHVNALSATPSVNEMEALLVSGKVDALAANRQRLLEAAAQHPTLRVLPDDYFVAGQAIALAKGDPSRVEGLNRLLADILRSGVVHASVDHAGLHGVDVPQPPPR